MTLSERKKSHLVEMQVAPSADIVTMANSEIRKTNADEFVYGARTVVEEIIIDLHSKSGKLVRAGREGLPIQSNLLLEHAHFFISAGIGVVVCGNLASLLTLNLPFALQGIASPLIAGLIGIGSEWVAAHLVSDVVMLEYRLRKEASLKRSRREAINCFRRAFIDGKLEAVRIVENEAIRPHLILAATIVLAAEVLGGLWMGYQASGDWLQALPVGIAPIGFILMVASYTAHTRLIPEKKANLLNAYRRHLDAWRFEDDDEMPPQLVIMPSPRPHSHGDGHDVNAQ